MFILSVYVQKLVPALILLGSKKVLRLQRAASYAERGAKGMELRSSSNWSSTDLCVTLCAVRKVVSRCEIHLLLVQSVQNSNEKLRVLKKKRFLFTQRRGSIYTVVVQGLLKLWLGSSKWPSGLSCQIPIFCQRVEVV